jgi:predicted O-methyltransferase YrrM
MLGEASSEEDIRRFVRALYRGVLRREPDDAGHSWWTYRILSGATAAEVVEAFTESEEFKQSLATGMYVPPGHFYSPIVDTAEAGRYLTGLESRGVPDAVPDVSIDRLAMVRKWNELAPLMRSAPFRETPTPDLRYCYDNPSYSWGDGSVLHAMLRLYRPKKLIEIGSGYSSVCALDTVERYLKGECQLTFIDPYPQLLLKLVGETAAHIRILDRRVQQVPLETFDELGSGDILFIDSTHVLRTGSDVCFELFEVLPRLAKGVLVHIHDMFWPFEYPRIWVIDENRSWNELYAVRAFLMCNDAWKVVMFNDYMAKLERPLIETTFASFLRNSGGALWLQRS